MKNTTKNNAADLFSTTIGTKPIDSPFATASQIFSNHPFLTTAGVDETFLRNRAREINPRTSAPWIPKPKNNQFHIAATIKGLCEWFAARAATAGELPTSYDSAQAMANSFSATKKSILWLTKNGAASAQLGGSRIDPLPVIQRALEICDKIADGTVTGIDNLEQWNKDTELAKKLRLESEKLEDEKLLRKGEMLLSREGDFAINRLLVDELIHENILQPARAQLVKIPRAINRAHKTILTEAGTPPAAIQKCADITTANVAALLDKLRSKIPSMQSSPPHK